MSDDLQVIRVLHILGPLRPSGMERMLVSATGDFAREGVQATVYGSDVGSVYADELSSAGYGVFLGPGIASSWAAAKGLRRLVRDRGIDVIHIHTETDYLRTALVSRWALGARHGRVVRTVHNVFTAHGAWRFSRAAQALIGDRLVQDVIAPSQDVAVSERRIGRRCKVIHNWVDDRFFRLREQRASQTTERRGAPVALLVGNCSDIKRHELALQAVMQTGMSVVHLGDEEGASATERSLLDSLEQQGRIRGRGVLPPDAALLTADVFLMPSRHEGFSVALAEALAVGVPALVSDAPGFQWARGLPGVSLLPDSPSAWVDALREFSSDGVAKAAMEVPIDLSAHRGAKEYADVYRRLAKRTKVEP